MACVPSLVTPSELSLLSLVTSAWRYESWLHAYPLNRATVLDYFKHSPFYSLQANNERINAAASQQQQQQQQHGASVGSQSSSSFSSSLSALRHMEGLEYALDPPQPATATTATTTTTTTTATANTASISSTVPSSSYFVIRKQLRVSPSVVELLSVYYIVAAIDPPTASSLPVGSVIPMPHFHSLAQCALDSSAATLTAAMHTIARLHARRSQRKTEQTEDQAADSEDWKDDTAAHRRADEQSGELKRLPAALVEQDDDADEKVGLHSIISRPLFSQMAADVIRMMSAS